MSEISGLFGIARSALVANKKALDVTAQNISNVNTPAYTRQEAFFESLRAIDSRPGQMGTGVEISQIRRKVDRFIENELTGSASNEGQFKTSVSFLKRIESAFSDLEGTGISQAFNDFFNALQDLSSNPASRPERLVLMEQGKSISQRFSEMDGQFKQIQKNTNTEILAVFGEVNRLSQEIAALNGQINQAEMAGHSANDLRDQRQLRLNDLAKNIDIQTFENKEGMISIFVGNGRPLVEGTTAMQLKGGEDPDNQGFVKVIHDSGTGSTSDLSGLLRGGKLQALLEIRDMLLPGYMDSLDRLAAGFAKEINLQHQAGYGLDGSTGNNFFSPLNPSVAPSSLNTGTAAVSAVVSDASALTLDNYDLTISGGNYTLLNKATGASTSAAYVDPAMFTFEGLQVTISGSAANGDTFRLSSHRGTAENMALALANPDQIAASGTAVALPGNNGNALLLSGIQESGLPSLGGATLQSFYAAFEGDVGTRSQTAQRNLSAEEVIKTQITQMREEVSGVSLDEEMSNIIKFQRAYEAAARMIAVADELLQTILEMKR